MKIWKRILKILGIVFGVFVLIVVTLAAYHYFALKAEADEIIPNGQMVSVNDYKVHVYSEGENPQAPTLVFLSGSATVAPVYDFKPLYSLLTDTYKIAVVEKAGYGYSDIVETERDVESMVTEVRTALQGANINAPYILLPHSMSGLEAIYWAQQFPEEVSGIVGIDMSTPTAYDDFDFGEIEQMVLLGGTAAKLGLIRIPGVYPLNDSHLTADEKRQQRLLAYRNAVNIDYIIEGKAVYENAQTVKAGKDISCPIMMFSSNGKQIGDFWISAQEEYAKANHGKVIFYDCGHYLHYYKSKEMAPEIKQFIEQIN